MVKVCELDEQICERFEFCDISPSHEAKEDVDVELEM